MGKIEFRGGHISVYGYEEALYLILVTHENPPNCIAVNLTPVQQVDLINLLEGKDGE